MADAIVVGGGIAGLSCAWRLHKAGVDVIVLEAETVCGGNVRTEEADGFRFEHGPHTFMASATDIFDLVEEVGLEDQVVATRPEAKYRFIVRDERLHRVPTGLWSFMTTGLLSMRGKLKLAGEPFRTERGQESDTAKRFFDRRFGPEAARIMAGAFISGVYAGDPCALSARAAFPLFWGFEQQSGGMIRGALKLRKERKAERKARGETGKPRRGLFSFREGLGQLTGHVAGLLGDRCRVGTPARAIVRVGDGFQIQTDGDTLEASRIVLAVPPAEASQLAGPLDAELAESLAAIPMAPVAVAHMGHRYRAPGIPDGFGFLAPRGQGVRSLGVLFPGRLFDGRAPDGGDLLSGFVGGVLDREALDLGDDQVVSIVQKDLKLLTGMQQPPTFVRVNRYPRAIPQMTLEHPQRMESVQARLEGLPGLSLAGNYLRGVGMKDAVGSGFEAAANLVAGLRTGVAGL